MHRYLLICYTMIVCFTLLYRYHDQHPMAATGGAAGLLTATGRAQQGVPVAMCDGPAGAGVLQAI